jgi:hypothetical protein
MQTTETRAQKFHRIYPMYHVPQHRENCPVFFSGSCVDTGHTRLAVTKQTIGRLHYRSPAPGSCRADRLGRFFHFGSFDRRRSSPPPQHPPRNAINRSRHPLTRRNGRGPRAAVTSAIDRGGDRGSWGAEVAKRPCPIPEARSVPLAQPPTPQT